MKKIKMYLVMLVVSMLLPISVSAQVVKGRLVDESNHPLPYANVVLLSLPDSAFATGTISGEDGAFSLEATSENQILKISSIGYKTVYKPTSPVHIGIVQLVSDAQMLGEVVVKANLPVTRIKNDALETNVQGTVLSKAGTAEANAKSQPEHQLNIYYAGQIGKGELTWDADYYRNAYTQYSLNAEDSQDHEDRTVTSDNKVDNQLVATKASYTHPLWRGSISVGGEYTYTDRHDDYVNQEGYVPTTYTRIREQNLAAYAQYSHPLPFGQANIGLRYEHVDFDYFENGTFVPGQSLSMSAMMKY